MFAPLVVAARTASQARESLEHTRESLAHSVEEGVQVARTLVDRARNEDPGEDETPREAHDELEDEYRPLMQNERETSGTQSDDEQRTRGRPRHRVGNGTSSGLDGKTVERKTRSWEVAISYGCFFVLGERLLVRQAHFHSIAR